MRKSVALAWPVHVDHFEGTLTWMYCDTKLKVTTGVGNLIDSPAAAVAVGPWFKADGTVATAVEVAAEWQRVKALTSLAKQSGWAYRAGAKLNLKPARVAELLTQTTARFWTNLAARWPVLESAPADAQLAALDLAWQNGYAFLDLKQPDGSWTWPNMRAAWTSGDWTKAALAVPDPHPDEGDDDQKDRAEARKRLFRNAASVIALGANPETLWDTRTPVAPPPPVKEDDMPTPQEVADAVLTRDGKIPNRFTSNAANEYVSLATALAAIGDQLDQLSAAVAALKPTTITATSVTKK